MQIARYTSMLRKWWWLIILATALASGLSYWSSVHTPRTYRTSTAVQVGQFIEALDPRLGDLTTSQQLAQIYAQSVNRQPVLQATIDALGLDLEWQTLARQVSTLAPSGTQLVWITVADTDPLRAKRIADEIANQLVLQSPTSQDREQEQHRQFVGEQLAALQKNINDAETQVQQLQSQILEESSAVRIRDLQNKVAVLQQQMAGWQATYGSLLDFYNGSRTNYLRVVDPAPVPDKPVGPNTRSNVLLAASIGFLLAVGAILVIEYVEDTMNTAEDVTRVLALPTLGSVMDAGRLGSLSSALIAMKEPRSQVSEAYHFIRTSIQFACGDQAPAVLLITSPSLGDGKSTTAANLAVSLAQNGKQVVLVDADLRRPSIHSLFKVPNRDGLISVLSSERLQPLGDEQDAPTDLGERWKRRVESHLVSSGLEGLRLLLAGPAPLMNPVDLLASAQMQKVLEILKDMADVVILDSPPAVPLADASVLAAGAEVVLVVEAGKTRSRAARLAKQTVLRAQTHVLGVVLNKTPRSGFDYYRYRYSRRAADEQESTETNRAADIQSQQA